MDAAYNRAHEAAESAESVYSDAFTQDYASKKRKI
jgi:hypothetical protein